MVFHFTADCTFEVEDIDDAMIRMSAHFMNLSSDGLDAKETLINFAGDIKLDGLKQ